MRKRTKLYAAAWKVKTHSTSGPEPSDIIVSKRPVNPFLGTDLEMVLHTRDTDTLVLFRIATSGVVLSTLLHASDADY